MHKSIQQAAYWCIVLSTTVALLILAKTIMVQIIFAVFLSLSLIPLCNFLEKKALGKMWAVVLTFLILFLGIGLFITFFSFTLANIVQDLDKIRSQLEGGIRQASELFQTQLNITNESITKEVEQNATNIVRTLWSYLQNSLSASISTITSFFFIIIYMFLILLYRKGIKRILLKGTESMQLEKLFMKIKAVIASYFSGLTFVIIILAIFNSLGLWIIGIDYALFWGVLGACFIIIPYIGTALGGALPFFYAIATTDTYWQPIAVVIFYFLVQQLEGSFITPKVVGSKINVNALAVIFALFLGGYLWGIAGMILSVPMVGVLRVIFSHFSSTKKLGALLSNGVHD